MTRSPPAPAARIRLPLLLAILLLLPAGARAKGEVTPPAEFLGRPVGADFKLADWEEVSGYFERLAAESPRVRVETVGTTTEGRDFLLATVSSEANLARLGEIRAIARKIADPRGLSSDEKARLLEEGRVVLFISCAMHATETAAPQLAMELAHALATSDAEPYAAAREKLVVLIAPSLNPDGLHEVVSWYRKTVGTPHEGADLLRLYQLYAGHDNNRDWFALTQAETRIVTRLLYKEWFPQVYWDVHQQGRGSERLFVPPFRDPLNPNLDPAIIAAIDALGSRALFDLTREGFRGVSTGVTYDMWWNGGNRNVPVRHNVIGLLTEAASVNIASPVFLPLPSLTQPSGLGPAYAPSNRFPAPWPGGWWRLRDIIDYEMAFARSLLGSLAREPRTWLASSLGAAERALAAGREGAPRAWLIPADNEDPGAVERLVDTLLAGGVEVHVADGEVVADGRSYPAGTLVVGREQPYGAHVKDLFEVQRYPEGDPPYDVAGWTLPLLLGVRRVEVFQPIQATAPPPALRRVETAAAAVAGFARAGPGRGWAEGSFDTRDSRAWKAAIAALAAGETLVYRSEGEAAGTFSRTGGAKGARVAGLPRVGVYAPWEGSMDEGWLRYVLDTYGLRYVRVRNEMLRAGALGAFLDVLVLPNVSAKDLDEGRAPGTVPGEYAGGLDPEGAVAIEEFVRRGGTLVAIGRAGAWTRDLFDLPLADVARSEESGGPPPGGEKGEKKFACPGSVLRAIPGRGPMAAGLPASLPVFFADSSAWRVRKLDEAPSRKDRPFAVAEGDVEVLLRYAQTRILLSGWIRAPETIADRAAWLRVRYGTGRIHLFGVSPQFRGWSQATFQLLFRAILLEGKV